VITEVTSKSSGKATSVFIPKPHFSDEEQDKHKESEGDVLVFTKFITQIDEAFQESDKSLKDFGIPALHILSVLVADERRFIELSGDGI